MSTLAVAPRDLADHLLSHGISWVSLAQAAQLLGQPEKQAASALTRLRQQGRFFSPLPGLYFPVPPQYRTWGALPALDFIDPLMTAIGSAYYVGYLSAAELHGAAHQRPQVFQVVAAGRPRDRDFGRVKVRFYSSTRIGDVPTQWRTTSTGRARVSTPAVTTLDLTSRPGLGGGLSNVATVLAELVEETELSAASIVEVQAAYPTSSLRRLGWLLEFVGADIGTGELLAAITRRDPSPTSLTLLDPRAPRRGRHDARWGLTVNQDVEPDL